MSGSRMKGARGVCIAVALVLRAVAGCVGDEPAEPPRRNADVDATTDGPIGPVQGTEGGECFPNTTCLGTLSCRSNRCVDLGAGDAGDAGSDVSSRDADADTSVVYPYEGGGG